MIAFVVAATAMTLVALAFILRTLWQRPRHAASRKTANLAIHAAELAALDVDLQAGLLDPASHAAARDEILRSALAADAEDESGFKCPPRGWLIAAVLFSVPITALLVYGAVGEPSAVGYSRADAQTLEQHLQRSPGDGRGWVLLARVHMNAERFAAAVDAYERALATNAKVAADPQIWCELADATALAQGGILAGRPRELIEKALALGPTHPRALEMAGSAAFEAREYDKTVAYWSGLLVQLPPGSEAHSELELALARLQGALAR
ncbi:MAG TPA: c-type cytochrome biogenesis protein CcmI [Burkholderiales bacterium]